MPPVGQIKYTPEQKQAVVHATLFREPRLSLNEVVRRAPLGLLGVEPFTIPKSTAAWMRTEAIRERDSMEASHLAGLKPDAAVEELRRRLLKLVEKRLRFVERMSAAKLSFAELDKLFALAKRVRDLDTSKPNFVRHQPTAPKEHEDNGSFVAELEAKEKSRMRSRSAA